MTLSAASALGQKAEKKTISPWMLWLLGIIVCYQAGYQLLVSLVLRQDRHAVDPWCASGSSASDSCIEAQLFRGWQEDVSGGLKGMDEPAIADVLQKGGEQVAMHQTIVHPDPHVGNENATLSSPLRGNETAMPSRTVRPTLEQDSTPATNQSAFAELQRPKVRSLTPLAGLQSEYEAREASRKKTQAISFHKRVQARHERDLSLAREAIEEWKSMSAWANGLKALHDHVDEKLASLESESATTDLVDMDAWLADLDVIQTRLQAGFSFRAKHGKASVAMSAWTSDLEARQRRMEQRMQAHRRAHHALDAMVASVETHKKANDAPKETMGDLSKRGLLHEMAEIGRQLCQSPSRRARPECAHFRGDGELKSADAPSGDKVDAAPRREKGKLGDAHTKLRRDLHRLSERHKAWEASLATRVANVGRTLCAGQAHDANSSCAQFQVASTVMQSSQTDSIVDSIAERRRSWHDAFKAKITSVGEELCKNPSHQQYLICKKFFTINATTPSLGGVVAGNGKTDGTPTPARRANQPMELQWRFVTQRGASTKALRGSARVESESVAPAVDLKKLRHARWLGHIPSVACITVVPRGKAVKVWMRYFLDNLRLQKYEGVIQLVLVYHHTDLDTAELVHDFRKEHNGTIRIRGAAARDPEYPSPAAYRFGAWVARDADIVARWDFEAWHHPHRLSTQVRALTFSARPACLLNSWTVLDDTGKRSIVSADSRWESSFVGEAAWMRANWYPRMTEQRGVVATHARDLVRLSSPGLLVFHGPVTV